MSPAQRAAKSVEALPWLRSLLDERGEPDWIAAPYVRRGLASAATVLLTEAAFSQPRIEVVEVRHDEANIASLGVPRGLGFTRVGERTGEAGVQLVWRMWRDDWKGIESFDGRVAEFVRPVRPSG